jgi:hypothetical protein
MEQSSILWAMIDQYSEDQVRSVRKDVVAISTNLVDSLTNQLLLLGPLSEESAAFARKLILEMRTSRMQQQLADLEANFGPRPFVERLRAAAKEIDELADEITAKKETLDQKVRALSKLLWDPKERLPQS